MSKPSPTATRQLKAATGQTLSDVEVQRLQALLNKYPSLPLPIATAMVKRAANGPVGSALNRLEEALNQLNDLPDLGSLSGSEVRVLDVILDQITSTVANLRNSLNQTWSQRS